MTAAEIKAELNAVREKERKYKLAVEKANSYRQTLTGGNTLRYSNSGSISGGTVNFTELALCRLADYDADTDKLLNEYLRCRSLAEKYINSLVDTSEREVLTRRYLMGEKWENIAKGMHYSERRIMQLHGKALKNISVNFS